MEKTMKTRVPVSMCAPRRTGHSLQRSGCRLLPLAVAALALIPPAEVHAQRGALEEILVTARKREESVQSVPIAISSFSGDMLASSGAVRITDISLHTPNMMFTPTLGNGTGVRTTIRGQTQDDIIGTVDASIGLYVDDVIWSRPVGSNMNLADIDRVEVLRGPQGTLFGRNTTGGAIQVYTRNPEHHYAARVGLSVGNFGRFDYNVMANAPLVEDRLAFRIAYDAQKSDGWQDNVIDGYELGQDDTRNLIAKLLFQPTDKLELLLKLDQARGNYRGTGSKMAAAEGGPAIGGLDAVQLFSGFTDASANYIDGSYDRITEGDRPLTDFRNEGAALTIDWELSDALVVRFIGAYRELDYFTDFDLDGTPYPILGTRTSLDGHRQQSAELQFTGVAIDERLDWTVGVYTFEEKGLDGSDTRIPDPIIRQITRGETRNTSQAVFGQGTFAVTDELSVTLGLRYSEESKDLNSSNHAQLIATDGFLFCTVPSQFTGDPNSFSEAGCNAKFERDDDSLDYALMVNYSLSPALMVYFKTATGFRSGGQNLRGGDLANPNSDASVLSFNSFEPETVTEYEVGFKGDFLGGRLRSNVALFHSEYDDIQRSTIVPVAGGGTATVVDNAASATVQGIELEITALPVDDWQVGVTAGWTDAEYDEFSYRDRATGNVIDRSGESLVSVPEYTASIWSAYTVALPLGSVTLRADYGWIDKHITFAGARQDGVDTPAKGLLNARAQWDVSDNLSLALWGRNLTDESYRVAGIEFYDNFGYALGIGNEPRTYGVDITYRIGD
jgi:iron complex outermembrane receptor protein